MIQFYAPDIETALRLPESDSKHCIRVLRMSEGDEIEAVDGKGHRFRCRLADNNPKGAAIEIIEKVSVELPWKDFITVAVAPTKNMDRMEWMVEKLTELGINRIVPLLCAHSERKEIKTERLEKIAVSAMKQSLKSVLPEITPITPIKKFLKESDNSRKYVCYCDDAVERKLLCKEYRGGDATILIGPEGDFSPEEIKECLDCGFVAVTLGDTRLRTETAAIAAVETCHIINQLKS